MSNRTRIETAAALDQDFSFLEDPQRSIGVDQEQATEKGPLTGMLVGVKSNIAVARQAWTAGIRARSAAISEQDAEIVRRLRSAGAGLLSQLTMDEAAVSAATEASGFRATRNPAALGFSVGGSSGGSAAAVACGAVDVALGSDTLGSVRIPAAYCGVLGLKPGRGVLPMDGVFPLSKELDTLGLLAAKTDPIRKVMHLFQPQTGAQVSHVCRVLPEAPIDCAPSVLQALDRVRDVLEQRALWAGETVLPGWTPSEVRKAAYGVMCLGAMENLRDAPVAGAAARQALRYGARLTTDEAKAAKERCASVAGALSKALADGTVLITPTTAVPAFPQGQPAPASQADFTALANLAGIPAIAVPIHVGPLPCSVQLMGAPGQENTLLDLADVFIEAA